MCGLSINNLESKFGNICIKVQNHLKNVQNPIKNVQNTKKGLSQNSCFVTAFLNPRDMLRAITISCSVFTVNRKAVNLLF